MVMKIDSQSLSASLTRYWAFTEEFESSRYSDLTEIDLLGWGKILQFFTGYASLVTSSFVTPIPITELILSFMASIVTLVSCKIR